MKYKIINLLTDLLADQTEMEVQINEVYGTDRQGNPACRVHGNSHVAGSGMCDSEVDV